MTQNDEELWQQYNERGEPIGSKGITKFQGRSGMLHGASHVWIWRGAGDDLEILLQKRGVDMPTWPGCFDISAAGHIDFGEPPLQTAIRETREEIGYDIEAHHLRLLFVHRARLVTGNISENEFQWIYGLHLNDTQATFAHKDGEVDSLLWVKLDDFKRLAAQKMPGKRMVPHGEVYFVSLLKEIVRGVER